MIHLSNTEAEWGVSAESTCVIVAADEALLRALRERRFKVSFCLQ